MRKLITLLTFLLFISPVFAGAVISRTQTVYSVLDWTGKPIETSVVNWLRVEDSGQMTITEEPDLSEIISLDPSLKPEISGKTMSWSIDGNNDIFYTGKTTKELPVKVTAELSLNGKTTNPEDVIGKSGELSFKVAFTNMMGSSQTISWQFGNKTESDTKTIYSPFTVMVQVDIAVEDYDRLDAPGAYSMVIGSHRKLMWTSLPRSTDTFTLKYSAKSLVLPSIQVSIIPKVPEIAIPEIDASITDLLSTFSDSNDLFDLMDIKIPINPNESLENLEQMEQLLKSTNSIIDGFSKQINDFTTVFSQAETAFTQMSTGAKQLGELSKGQKQVLEMMKIQMQENTGGLVTGISTLQTSSDLASQVSRDTFTIKTNLEDIQTTIRQLKSMSLDQDVISKLDDIDKIIQNSTTRIDNIKTDADKASINLKTLMDGGTIGGKEVPAIGQLPEQLDLLNQVLTALVSGGKVMGNDLPGLTTTIDGLKGLEDGLNVMLNGGNINGKTVPPLSDVPKRMNEAYNDMSVITKGGIINGIKVKPQEETLKMISGFKKTLNDFMPIQEKLDKLSTKMNDIIKKAGGKDKLKDMTGDVGKLLYGSQAEYDKMKELAQNYTSFVGKTSSSSDGSVLFVLKFKEFEAIKTKKADQPVSTADTTPYSVINEYKYYILIVAIILIILSFIANWLYKRRINNN